MCPMLLMWECIPHGLLLCVCDDCALHCYVPYYVCVCVCVCVCVGHCAVHRLLSLLWFAHSLMDKQIFACFTLFVSPFFFLLLLILPLLLFAFSFSLYLKSLHHHCTPPSKNTMQISPLRSTGRLVFSLFTLLKPRPGRLEPCCASILLGASGPSRPLSQDPNPIVQPPCYPNCLPTLLLPYMLPCTT